MIRSRKGDTWEVQEFENGWLVQSRSPEGLPAEYLMSLLTSAERDQVQSEVQVVHVSFGDGAGEELDMRLFPSWDLLYKSPVRVLRVEMRKHAEVSLFAPRHERKVLI